MISIFNPKLLAVEVEINSFCNRKCINCPNHNHERPYAFLEDNLFRKIVDELHDLEFNGRFTFNMFNEPLLDKRLPSFISYVRNELPSVFIYLNTNGDLLDIDKWRSFRYAGLDHANISQYDGKFNDNIVDFLRNLDDDEREHTLVRIFDIEKDATNMGGLVQSHRNVKLPLRQFCVRPFYQLCINYRGHVPLCCLDYLPYIDLGDVHKESLMAIWTSKKYAYYRFWLANKNRAHIMPCKSCDNTETKFPTLLQLNPKI